MPGGGVKVGMLGVGRHVWGKVRRCGGRWVFLAEKGCCLCICLVGHLGGFGDVDGGLLDLPGMVVWVVCGRGYFSELLVGAWLGLGLGLAGYGVWLGLVWNGWGSLWA